MYFTISIVNTASPSSSGVKVR